MFESRLPLSVERRNRIEKDKAQVKGTFVQEHDEYARVKSVRSTQGSFVCLIELRFKDSRVKILDALEAKIRNKLDIKTTKFQDIATFSLKKDDEFNIATLEAKLFFIE